jgi:hypothetical protein
MEWMILEDRWYGTVWSEYLSHRTVNYKTNWTYVLADRIVAHRILGERLYSADLPKNWFVA